MTLSSEYKMITGKDYVFIPLDATVGRVDPLGSLKYIAKMRFLHGVGMPDWYTFSNLKFQEAMKAETTLMDLMDVALSRFDPFL